MISPAPITDKDHEEINRELQEALERIKSAKSGSRNDTLNRNAFIVGKMVGAGAIDHADALAKVVDAAIASGLSEIEARQTAISGIRSGIKRPWRPYAVEPELSAINRDYFYALEGRTGFVFMEDHDAISCRRTIQHITPTSFREKFGNIWMTVQSGNRSKQVPVGTVWMKWPGRRQYDKVVFAPGKALPPSVYNMWQGFAFEPAHGDCSKFLGLILDVICNGDPEIYRYLVSWMARAVQRPWDPGEVAIVMRGEKGTGKTFFVEHFGELFGEHFIIMSSSHHLVGNFNAHLETAIIVFADEAFWAGDKQGEGTLKTLITGKTIRVERKGIDSKMVANHIHLIMASNSDWVVPASTDERRYLVLEVSSAHRQDHAYFEEIESEWAAGGREAMLELLTKHDLTDFNVRNVPATRALSSQKLLSLPPMDRWYLGMLRAGDNTKNCWRDWVSFDDLWGHFSEWCKDELVRAAPREALGMRLSALLPPAPDGRNPRRQRTSENAGKRLWGYAVSPTG